MIKDVINTKTKEELIELLEDEGYHILSIHGNWIFAEKDGAEWEMEATVYSDRTWSLRPENISRVRDLGGLEYGLFCFDSISEYEEFSNWCGFTDYNTGDHAEDFLAENDENAKEIADSMLDEEGLTILCRRYSYDDYEPLFIKKRPAEDWRPFNTLHESLVDMRKDDILFYVVKRKEDSKYLSYKGVNPEEGIIWVEDLDHAEAFDDENDIDDLLHDFVINNFDIPEILQNIEDEYEKADAIIDWKEDKILSDYESIPVRADRFYTK